MEQDHQSIWGKIEKILAGSEKHLFLQVLEAFYRREQEEEYFSPEDLAAIQEGEEAIRRGEYISLEEYERKRGL